MISMHLVVTASGKSSRMDKTAQTGEEAANRDVPIPDFSNERIFPGGIKLKAVFDPSMKWHLIEAFGMDSFRVQTDGNLLFEHEYTDKENLIIWMLSCKDKVTVLEPEEIRRELYHIANNIQKSMRSNEALSAYGSCQKRWRP